MRSDNATQNAMQWKCIALRRTAARKLPLLPPYGRRNQKSLNCLFHAFILLVWSQYVLKLTPFWGVFPVFIGRSCCLHFGCFCRQFMRGISWLLSCCCSLCSCCCSLCIDPCLACCCFDDPPLAAVSRTVSAVLQVSGLNRDESVVVSSQARCI